MKFNFDYNNKKIDLEVEECKNILQKARGLMFRKKSKPLLFYFKKENRQAIHSFFCVPFVAVWFDKNRIVDVKCVKPWRISVRPKEKFDRLLEIPENDINFLKFYRGKRKI